LERLQAEHELSVQLWGQDHALRILARMLRLQESAKDASPVSNAVASSTQPASLLANPALGLEVSKVMTAFYQNQYFKSIEALFALATYRCAQLVEWLPVFGVFVFAVWFDGYVRRIVKSKEFLHHNPEVFGLHVCLIIIILGAAVVALIATEVHSEATAFHILAWLSLGAAGLMRPGSASLLMTLLFEVPDVEALRVFVVGFFRALQVPTTIFLRRGERLERWQDARSTQGGAAPEREECPPFRSLGL